MTFKKVQLLEALAVLSTSIRAQNLTIGRQEIEELSAKSMVNSSRMEGLGLVPWPPKSFEFIDFTH